MVELEVGSVRVRRDTNIVGELEIAILIIYETRKI